MTGNNSRVLLIPIETKVREFQAKVFFAARALERGYEVWLGSAREMFQNLFSFPRATLLLHHVGHGYKVTLPKAYHYGMPLVAWDEESLVVKNDDFYVRERVPLKHISLVDQFYTRGAGDYNALLRHYPFLEGRLYQTGNPRLDILSPDYLQFHQGVVSAPIRRRVMINSRFSHSNPAHMSAKAFRQGQLQRFEDDPASYKYKSGYMDYTDKLFREFYSMVEELSRSLPDTEFVLRPHPSEDEAIWQRLAQARSNLLVTKEHTATAWSLSAAATIHNGCTTAIESSLLGCNVIAYEPLSSDRFDVKLPNSVSWSITDIDQLTTKIRDIEMPDMKERMKIAADSRVKLSSVFAGLAGKRTASDLVLDALEGRPPQRRRDLLDISSEWKDRGISWLSRTRRGLGLNPAGVAADRAKDAYFSVKFPGLSREEVERSLRISGAVNFSVCMVGENWVRIAAGGEQ